MTFNESPPPDARWREQVTFVQHRVWGPGDTYQTANGEQVDFPAGTQVRRFVTEWEKVEV